MNVVSNMQVPEAFKGDILERGEKGKVMFQDFVSGRIVELVISQEIYLGPNEKDQTEDIQLLQEEDTMPDWSQAHQAKRGSPTSRKISGCSTVQTWYDSVIGRFNWKV